MTLDAMNAYLEDKGFAVERHYDRVRRMYRFTLIKNGVKFTREFKYPETNNWDIKDCYMKKYLDDIVKEFDEFVTRYGSVDGLTGKDFYDNARKAEPAGCYIPGIKRVIFNPPVTVVLWMDGTKTIVRANGDDEPFFDPEKGLAMAITKKALGNKGTYFDTIKKWVDPWLEEDEGGTEE